MTSSIQQLSRRRLLRLAALGLTGPAAVAMLGACSDGAASPTAEPPAPAGKPPEVAQPASAPAPTTALATNPAQAAPAAAGAAPSGPFGPPEQANPEIWWVRDVQMSGGYIVAAESSAAAAIGQQQSFFAQEGLQPDLKPYVSGTDLPNMMASGQVYFASGTAPAVISMIASGLKVRIVAAHCDIAGNQGIVVRKGAGLENPSELMGKKIGLTTGASMTVGVRNFLKEVGVEFDDITFVNGQPPDLVSAFGKGDLDGYAGWEPWLSNAEKLGGTRWMTGSKRLYNGSDEPTEYLILHSVVVVQEDYLARNPNTVAAFLRGLKKGIDFINGNLDRSVQLLTEPMRIQPDDLTRMMKAVKYSLLTDDRFVAGSKAQGDFLVELKRVPRNPDPKEYLDLTILARLYPELAKVMA